MDFVSKVIVFILFISASYQQDAPFLQPFGPTAGDTTLARGDDNYSGDIYFINPIVLWGTSYSSCYISNNGWIGVGDVELDVFQADVDTRPDNGGYVYYRVTADAQQLNSVSTWIRSTQGNTFQGTTMFIATWYKVGYWSRQTDKLNTFQAVIIGDDNSNTYVIYNYGSLQWGDGAYIGYDASDDVNYASFPGSGISAMSIAFTTNAYINGVPQTGQYVFKAAAGAIPQTSSTFSYITSSNLVGCDSDEDCNEYGLCINSYQGGGCSCFSGFGGGYCDSRPASCAYNPVFSNVTNFSPSVKFSVANSQISFAITAALEQTPYASPNLNDDPTTATSYSLDTSIRFGNSFTPCDYPPTLASQSWTHNAVDLSCIDNWGLTVPWGYAVSNCGFSDSGHDHVWMQTVTVSRNYRLPDLGDGVPATRTESVSKILAVM